MCLLKVNYLYPPTSSSRTAPCSQPYPADMPFRTLHRSSSPQKNVACALDFLRYGFTEKRNVPIQYRRIVIAMQTAVCRGNPFLRGRSKGINRHLSNPNPPPFNEASPFREKRDVLTKIQRVIARQAAVCRGNPLSNRAQGRENSWRIDYLYPPATPLRYLRLAAKTISGDHYPALKKESNDIIPCLQ